MRLFYPTLIDRTQYNMSFAGQMTCSMLISYLYNFCQHLKNYDGFCGLKFAFQLLYKCIFE
jgi:hypothetical protein